MSAQRQMLIEQNIDEVLVERLVTKSNVRLRTRDYSKVERPEKINDAYKILRRARHLLLTQN